MNINFEGSVNGEKFTDLESFMNALKAIKDDNNCKDISLYYKTSWGDDDTKNKVKNGLSGLFQHKQKDAPDFSKATTSFDFDLFNGDSCHDAAVIDNLNKELRSKYDSFTHNYNPNHAADYEVVNENHIAGYNSTLDTADETINSLKGGLKPLYAERSEIQKEIDRIETKINICRSVETAVQTLLEFHDSVRTYIQSKKLC